MKQLRYTYSVAEWNPDEDIVLGEGSGPASHVIANLERMIEIIKAEEAARTAPARPSAVEKGQEFGREFFTKVASGEERAENWTRYLLSKATEEIRAEKPGVTADEIAEALEELKLTPEFGLAIQAGLASGAMIEQARELQRRRVQTATPGEDPNMPGTRAV
jgi:hypothetical protein